ncbi:MAG: SMP-30/gluconolactonase/LRE family protein [Okeania sp. SIO2D1]|nr:SMP-30/gluconolactonase/LRE family protein [Okeania sp. SIO2D1]
MLQTYNTQYEYTYLNSSEKLEKHSSSPTSLTYKHHSEPTQKIVGNNSKVEKLASEFQFTEGPVWHPSGFLLFSDIPGDTIYKWTSDGNISIFRHPAGNPNGNTFDLEGQLITAQHNRRLTRTDKNGHITVLADYFQGQRLNSPNDLVVRSDGSIYFTDPPYGIDKKQEELGFYGIYRLTPDGTLSLLNKTMVRPNGIAFSPGQTKLYVSDSRKREIRVFEVASDGTLTSNQVFVDMRELLGKGIPDGLKVDTQGNIYCSGSKAIWIFSPAGKLLDKINLPEVVTNLTWGDEDYRTLYITARHSIYRIRLKIAGVKVQNEK